MKKLLLGIVSAVLLSGIFVTSIAVAEENKIPSWIRITAGYWVDEKVSDGEFISALQFLIDKGILNVPNSNIPETTPAPVPETTPAPVPETTPAPVPETQKQTSEPEWIYFESNWFDEKIEIVIGLSTGDVAGGEEIAADGVAKIKIINDAGEQVYQKTINVRSNQFETFVNNFTGQSELLYLYYIPETEITPSDTSSGTVELYFKTGNTEFDIDSNICCLPEISQDSLNTQFENDYQNSATSVNQSLTFGSFKVILDKVGHFKQASYFDAEEYFRLDLTVTNVGNEKEFFNLRSLAVLDRSSNQYDKEYGGTLKMAEDIRSGVTVDGYVLVEALPKDTRDLTVVFELGRDQNYDEYTFEYNVRLR